MKIYVLYSVTPNISSHPDDTFYPGDDEDLLGVYSSPEKVYEKIEDHYGRMMPNKQFHTPTKRRDVIDLLHITKHGMGITKEGETYWKYLVQIMELDEV